MSEECKCWDCEYCKMVIKRKDGETVIVCSKHGKIEGTVEYCDDYEFEGWD